MLHQNLWNFFMAKLARRNLGRRHLCVGVANRKPVEDRRTCILCIVRGRSQRHCKRSMSDQVLWKARIEELKNSALECSGLWPIWDAESWNIFALFEQPIGHLLRTTVHVSSDSVWCVGYNTFPNQTEATNFVEVWDPTTFMDNYDITGRPVQFHRHIRRPDSDPNHRFKHAWDVRNPLIEKEESYSCRCSTTLNIKQKTTSNHVSQTQEWLPNTHTPIQLRSLVFLLTWTQVWYRTCSSKPSAAGDHIARKMTQKFEEASHPMFFLCWPILERL